MMLVEGGTDVHGCCLGCTAFWIPRDLVANSTNMDWICQRLSVVGSEKSKRVPTVSCDRPGHFDCVDRILAVDVCYVVGFQLR